MIGKFLFSLFAATATFLGLSAGAVTTSQNIDIIVTHGASLTTFALPPAGRVAGCAYGASDYPGGTGDVVNLDGTSGDSVESFGLTTPTPGVGSL